MKSKSNFMTITKRNHITFVFFYDERFRDVLLGIELIKDEK